MLSELVEKKAGEIDHSDMTRMLDDNIDVYALTMLPYMVNVTRAYIQNDPNPSELIPILDAFDKWDCDFDKSRNEPTLYTLWDSYFLYQFGLTQMPKEEIRLHIVGNHLFDEFLMSFYP